MAMREELGDNLTHDHIKEYLWKTLKSGQVVPGYVNPCPACARVTDATNTFRYGHGVLRSPDPRFIALQQFCDSRPELLSDPIVQLVKKVCGVFLVLIKLTQFCCQTFEVAPEVLTEHGKVSFGFFPKAVHRLITFP